MYLVFDIGGTNMRIATSQDGKTLDKIETTPTLTNFSEAISIFKQTALKLTKEEKIKAAAGGGRRLNHPTMPLWVNEPLKQELERILQTPVYLENDAALAGLGEATFGAGQGKKIVAFITVSTGVGGARIVEGHIDQNSLGFEPGSQIISQDTDSPGYLEKYVSGIALEKSYGKKGEQLNDQQVWDEVARILAIGLNNIIVLWSPDIVILGGSVAKSIPLEKVNKNLAQILKIFPQVPEVVRASLGEKGGLLGCLAYLNQFISLPLSKDQR